MKHVKYLSDDYTLSTLKDNLQFAFAFINYQDPNETFEDEGEYS